MSQADLNLRMKMMNVMMMPKITGIVKPICLYISWVILHWGAVQIYQLYCTPQSLWGVLGAFFSTEMPHCTATLYVINLSSTAIKHMWKFIAAWLISKMAGFQFW